MVNSPLKGFLSLRGLAYNHFEINIGAGDLLMHHYKGFLDFEMLSKLSGGF